jgi:GT2 family glycosyltransferase
MQTTLAATSKPATPKVSILIVNYNGARLTADCLNSLSKVKHPAFEIIVTDNASSDNSLEVLKQFPTVQVVKNAQNLGFAGGNNLGLIKCRGEFILLLNNDTIVRPDFLEPLVKYLETHPHVGVVQGKMLLPRLNNCLDVCGSYLTALGLPYHYGYQKEDGPLYQRSYPIFSGKGACLMFRRTVVEKVGGFLFDDDFFCYYEESDFCHRVWLAGYEVHFVPSPPIQHLMGATSGGPQSGFVLRHYLRNMTFSLLTNLTFTSRLRLLPGFGAMLFASFCGSVIRLRWEQVSAHIGILTHCWHQRKKISQRRKLIKSIRKQADTAIFRKTLRTPRLAYFIKTFTGKLADYKDTAI